MLLVPIIQGNEALISLADVDHIRFWLQFEIVFVIYEKRNGMVNRKITSSHKYTINYSVINSMKHFSKYLC